MNTKTKILVTTSKGTPVIDFDGSGSVTKAIVWINNQKRVHGSRTPSYRVVKVTTSVEKEMLYAQ